MPEGVDLTPLYRAAAKTQTVQGAICVVRSRRVCVCAPAASVKVGPLAARKAGCLDGRMIRRARIEPAIYDTQSGTDLITAVALQQFDSDWSDSGPAADTAKPTRMTRTWREPRLAVGWLAIPEVALI
jgi:hypothetical protein